MTDYFEEIYQQLIDKLQTFDHKDDSARWLEDFLYVAKTIDQDIEDNFEDSLEKFVESIS